MSTNDEPMSTLVTFRAPANLVAAMRAAAEKQFCTLSTIARAAAAREMRERGLLKEEA
jgi:hypothetical protein